MIFKIEKNIPMPIRTKYPWALMQIGDSVRFANVMEFRRAKGSASQWQRRLKIGKDTTFRFQTDEKKLRIWRIK